MKRWRNPAKLLRREELQARLATGFEPVNVYAEEAGPAEPVSSEHGGSVGTLQLAAATALLGL